MIKNEVEYVDLSHVQKETPPPQQVIIARQFKTPMVSQTPKPVTVARQFKTPMVSQTPKPVTVARQFKTPRPVTVARQFKASRVVQTPKPVTVVRQFKAPMGSQALKLAAVTHQLKAPTGGGVPKRTHLERMSLSGITSALIWINESTSMPPLEIPVIPKPEVETSRPGILSQLNIKHAYMRVMADPLYKNSLLNMASTLILGGLGFVFWIIIARLDKTENVGIATTIISIMSLLSSLTLLGLNVSLNRYLPRSTNKNELINSSFIIVTLVTLLACVLFLLGLPVFSPQLVFLRSNIFYGISFTLFVIFCSWNSLIESVFMAFRAATNILIKNGIISILKLMLPFVLVMFGAYGIFASTASAVSLAVLTSLMILMIRFKIRPSVLVNVPLIKETSAYSFANYVAEFMYNMPSLVLPAIILNALSAKYAAYYYVASMIQNILLIIPFATSQALLTEGSYDEAELKKHIKKAFKTIVIILIPATAVVVFAGNILLQVFGKNYANEAFQFLQLYSVSTIFTALLLIANAIMNVKHQIKLLVFSNVAAAALTLGLSYAFISGKLAGIGWGWLLGQAIAGLVAMFFIIYKIDVKSIQKVIR